jgi:predicted nucleic acid-binding Zn ribbon protein
MSTTPGNEPKNDFARELYKIWRSNSRKSKNQSAEETRTRVDDPQKLESVLSELVAARDWRQGIAEGTLFTEWKTVVGTEIATHATPVSLMDGLLTIQTTSTAWATQMSLIASQLLKTISQSAPGALVEEIAVIGPEAPSWKKGIRSIKNARGPRDTYG